MLGSLLEAQSYEKYGIEVPGRSFGFEFGIFLKKRAGILGFGRQKQLQQLP